MQAVQVNEMDLMPSGISVDPRYYVGRRIVESEQMSARSFRFVLDNGVKLSFILDAEYKMPWITQIEGGQFLEDAKILEICVRALSRQNIGFNDVLDYKAVIVKTSKGTCRIKYAHEHPRNARELIEIVWTMS